MANGGGPDPDPWEWIKHFNRHYKAVQAGVDAEDLEQVAQAQADFEEQFNESEELLGR